MQSVMFLADRCSACDAQTSISINITNAYIMDTVSQCIGFAILTSMSVRLSDALYCGQTMLDRAMVTIKPFKR